MKAKERVVPAGEGIIKAFLPWATISCCTFTVAVPVAWVIQILSLIAPDSKSSETSAGPLAGRAQSCSGSSTAGAGAAPRPRPPGPRVALVVAPGAVAGTAVWALAMQVVIKQRA